MFIEIYGMIIFMIQDPPKRSAVGSNPITDDISKVKEVSIRLESILLFLFSSNFLFYNFDIKYSLLIFYFIYSTNRF